MSSDSKKKRICLIGCGPSGMSFLHHIGKLPDDVRPEVVCYEKQSTWGGMWNVTWRTGTDEYGEHVHACMYHDLWINNPKEMTEYPDYTYKTHFGKPVPSFVPGPVFRGYIEGRCLQNRSKADFLKCTKFNTVVRWVEYNEKTDDFTVKVKDLVANEYAENKFTHVIIASGLFGTAYSPSFPGLEQFQGVVLHAKDVRRSKHFMDKRVLLIGSRLSALDLSLQFHKYGAKNVIVSYKFEPMGLKWPEGIEERQLVESFTETGVKFTDGTYAEIDAVVFCTGYKLHHPYLPDDLRINPEMSMYPDNLYKGIVWMKGGNMKLLYLGAMYCTFFLSFLDVQALWACQYLTGDTGKATRQQMIDDMNECINKKGSNESAMKMVSYVTDYLRSMCQETGYNLDMDKSSEIIHQYIKYAFEDVSTYRDKQFQSYHTGQRSAEPSTPWMKNFDYPLEYTEDLT